MQKKDTTANIINIALGTVQQQVRLTTPVLETNFTKYSVLLDDGWIRKEWNFLSEINGSIVIPKVWTPDKFFTNNIAIMERVMEMDTSTHAQCQINLCRLHKEYYFITDILGSKHRYLHPDVLHPHKKRPNLEKFPTVQVPHHYWKRWDTVIKIIYQSIRVSGFYPGSIVNKQNCTRLQHSNRSNIIRHSGNDIYIIYPLQSQGRKHYC